MPAREADSRCARCVNAESERGRREDSTQEGTVDEYRLVAVIMITYRTGSSCARSTRTAQSDENRNRFNLSSDV